MHKAFNPDRVDVCIPTFNRFDYVSKLTSSLPTSINIYLSDNGNCLTGRENSFSSNVKIIGTEKTLDMFDNWLTAADAGSAEWFLLPSDDDIYYENISIEIGKALSNHENIGMVVFGHNIVDEDDNILSSWVPTTSGIKSEKESFKMFSYGSDARMPSVLINRKIYQQVGKISTDFKLTAADSDLLQRIAMSSRVLFVREIVAGYRVWNGGLTHKKLSSAQWRDEIDLWMEKLEENLKHKDWAKNKIWRRHIQDDIRLQNANAGLGKIRGLGNAANFLFSKKYPLLARPKTHIRCLLNLAKCALRQE